MTSETAEALWSPTEKRIASTQLMAFMQSVQDAKGFGAGGDYFALHQWSLDEPAAFWRAVWDFTEIQGDPGGIVCDDPSALPGCRWFPNATLNFAENLLRFADDTYTESHISTIGVDFVRALSRPPRELHRAAR